MYIYMCVCMYIYMYICMLFRFFSIMGYNKMLSIVVHAVGLCCLSILYMVVSIY